MNSPIQNIELTDSELLAQKLEDASIAGSTVTFDPDEASLAGAFVEDALSPEDAEDSIYDGDLGENPETEKEA